MHAIGAEGRAISAAAGGLYFESVLFSAKRKGNRSWGREQSRYLEGAL